MSTHRPLMNIDAATSQAGAPDASRKNGGRKPKVAVAATRSGKRGRSRIATRLPVTSPTAFAVRIAAQAGAPPMCCLATRGPRTFIAAKQPLTTANCPTSSQTHGRELNSRQPSRRSARIVDGAPRAAWATRIPISSAAEAANVAASKASAHPEPTVATSTPATAEPMMLVLFWASRSRALAG
jgi:hypothetical protein